MTTEDRKNCESLQMGGERMSSHAIRPFRLPLKSPVLTKQEEPPVSTPTDEDELGQTNELVADSKSTSQELMIEEAQKPHKPKDEVVETLLTYIEQESVTEEITESIEGVLEPSLSAVEKDSVSDKKGETTDLVVDEPIEEAIEPEGDLFRKRPLRKFHMKRKPSKVKEPEGAQAVTKPVIPLRYASLQEAMSGVRDFHPLPSELILTQAPHHATWLMTQLKKVSTKEELEELAFSLSHRDLSLLFTTLSMKKRRDEIDQILNLIRLRASHYLYLCGWLTLQYCYPRSSVARALSDLCTILEDLLYVRENRWQNQFSQRKPLSLPVVSVGEGRIVWSRVPLISRIALPNSRHFISDIANEMLESKTDLASFFKEYAIIPDLPLANAIETRYNEMVTGVSANPLLSSDFFERFRR